MVFQIGIFILIFIEFLFILLLNRLTGGSHDAQCLQTSMSKGMGEGWSDAIALYVQRKEQDTKDKDVIAYEWPMNSGRHGLRVYPFSVNMTRNPLTCNSLF